MPWDWIETHTARGRKGVYTVTRTRDGAWTVTLQDKFPSLILLGKFDRATQAARFVYRYDKGSVNVHTDD